MFKFFQELFELISAYRKYDPATTSRLEIFLLYPGIKAWFFHRFAHRLYLWKIPFFPRFFSELARFFSGIEIHPGAKIGRRVLLDHGHGIVIGETAIIGDDVLIYQGVTLGGTTLERAKRHPTIERHCVLGSGAKILGNITIGEGTRIGSNSVVVKDVPKGSTVVGIPGRIVSKLPVLDGQELEHGKLPDPIQNALSEIEKRISDLEKSKS